MPASDLLQKSLTIIGLFLVLAITISIGYYFLNSTLAATPVVSIEADAGVISIPATKQVDATASGGLAVRFTAVKPSGFCPAKTIAIIGSSTAAGNGATPISNSWANRYATYIKTLNPAHTIVNMAVPGYTTYNTMPTGFTPPTGRPVPDIQHNITAAVALKPQGIILNMPTNDTARGYSVADIQSNFRSITSAADAAGIPIWITTTQPRNLSTSGLQDLITLKNWIESTYGDKSLDFWSTIANGDGTINPLYDSGDNVHVNNAGHQILYNEVVNSNVMTTLCATI